MNLYFKLFIPIFFVSIGWGLSPILEKYILNTLSYDELFILYGLMFGIISIIYFFYLKYYNKNEKLFEKNNIIKILPILLLAGFLSYIFGDLNYFKSLKNNNVSLVILLVSILPIIVTTLLSIIFFKNKLSIEYIFGLIVTFIGLSVVLKSSSKFH
tara:strand:- start:522 stop:989 length:468 start_codon:yes stop_codon:yes gene_type:complete